MRSPWHGNINIGTTEAASTALDVEGFRGGSVMGLAGPTTITIYGSVDGGTYGIAKDAGNNITITNAAGSPLTIPDAAMKFSKIKLVASAGTAATNVPVFLNTF
jgi:hypothetical protein